MNLLLAEDDAILADALSVQLRRAGFQVEVAPNGPVAEYLLEKHPFDLAILDLGLPMIDGLTVLKRLRVAQPNLPVVVLTAQDGLSSRVNGLNAGADDFVTKPFDFPELEARLRALLRRSHRGAAPEPGFGRLVFERESRRIGVAGQLFDLSPREWTLLELLVANRDRVVTKDLIAQTWSSDGGELNAGNSAEVYIHRLRRKLVDSGLVIRTVRGLGYILKTEAAQAAPSGR